MMEVSEKEGFHLWFHIKIDVKSCCTSYWKDSIQIEKTSKIGGNRILEVIAWLYIQNQSHKGG